MLAHFGHVQRMVDAREQSMHVGQSSFVQVAAQAQSLARDIVAYWREVTDAYTADAQERHAT